MPEYPPERIYAAARALLPDLDEPTRRRVEALLAQAEGGAATDLDILTLLTAHEATRERLRALLKGEAIRGETLLGYEGLPGGLASTPGQVFVCPEPGCGYRYVIGEAGETPPPCPRHGKPLIPAGEKKER